MTPIEVSAEQRQELARRFACRAPEKMKWKLGWCLQCSGCSGQCGTSNTEGFKQPDQQLDLFANDA